MGDKHQVTEEPCEEKFSRTVLESGGSRERLADFNRSCHDAIEAIFNSIRYKPRLRTDKGKASEWRDYKAVTLHEQAHAAFFQENEALVDWVNRQPLSETITCLGDGHPGVWNLMANISTPEQRREILDWYHLKENLYKLGGSQKQLIKVETSLWYGRIEEAIATFADWDVQKVKNFLAYLERHRQRIPDYHSFQSQGITIGSGTVESTIKQIGRRIKISGAQSILRTVLDLIEYLKPLMAIRMSIFSILKSSPEFQKTIKNARAYAVTLTESLKNCPKYCSMEPQQYLPSSQASLLLS